MSPKTSYPSHLTHPKNYLPLFQPPIIIKNAIPIIDTLWFILTLLKQKRKLRTLEKKWIKTKSESILALYQLNKSKHRRDLLN